MNRSELTRGRVVVDVRPVVGLDGELRVTTVQRHHVFVEFITVGEYRQGDWEPGLRWRGTYVDSDSLVASLEAFFGSGLDTWVNRTKEPLDTSGMGDPDLARSKEEFERRVHERTIRLPGGADYSLTSVYWQQIERHGDWDIDRALEEQDAELDGG